jgi:hypothetical protein
MDKTCFAYCENTVCVALKVKACPGDRCPFFMTTEQQEESRKKAYKRLACMDKATQRSIASTYYHGKMPWLEGGAGHDC